MRQSVQKIAKITPCKRTQRKVAKKVATAKVITIRSNPYKQEASKRDKKIEIRDAVDSEWNAIVVTLGRELYKHGDYRTIAHKAKVSHATPYQIAMGNVVAPRLNTVVRLFDALGYKVKIV